MSVSLQIQIYLYYLYNNGKDSVCLSVRLCVTSFQSNPYLSCFMSEFDAAESKLGQLIELTKTSIPPASVCPPFLVSQVFQLGFPYCKKQSWSTSQVYLD